MEINTLVSESEISSMMPYPVLESIPREEGILYSTLICQKSLLERYSDVNELASELQKTLALGFAKSIREFSDEEGDDYRFFLTERGKNILNTPHE